MSLQVKICGINSPAAAEAVLRAAADYAGLVFFPPSPRAVTPDAGRVLADRLRGSVRIVALTVDADDETLSQIVRAVRPDFLQLHGHESPARIAAVRSKFGIPAIKAVAVSAAEDFAAATDVMAAADMVLFDAKPPKNASRPGGLGVAFDWTLLQGRAVPRPWLLSGGLDQDNLARAVSLSGARAVDVSSGVERAPGLKDSERIAAFVAAARNISV